MNQDPIETTMNALTHVAADVAEGRLSEYEGSVHAAELCTSLGPAVVRLLDIFYEKELEERIRALDGKRES